MIQKRRSQFIAISLCLALIGQAVFPYVAVAQAVFMPEPGVMVHTSGAVALPVLRGVKVDPADPFHLEFILDEGDDPVGGREDATRLIRYFLAALTIPEDDLWVNLSPHEQDRIIPNGFGLTEMGRDLLAQDYLLKQLTASLVYPDDALGRQFWDRVYAEAFDQFGTTDIPVDTFNKVWIVPDTALVHEGDGAAVVTEARLKVMLETDHLAQKKQGALRQAQGEAVSGEQGSYEFEEGDDDASGEITKQAIRDVLIPVIEREVNEGENFAPLRQVYHALILAVWYKQKVTNSLLSQGYVDQEKVTGVNIDDPNETERIWERYVAAFKEGVFDMIREEQDMMSEELIPRRYFSGGMEFTSMNLDQAMRVEPAQSALRSGMLSRVFNVAKKGLSVLGVSLALMGSGASTGLTAERPVAAARTAQPLLVANSSDEYKKGAVESARETLPFLPHERSNNVKKPKESDLAQGARLDEGRITDALPLSRRDFFIKGLKALAGATLLAPTYTAEATVKLPPGVDALRYKAQAAEVFGELRSVLEEQSQKRVTVVRSFGKYRYADDVIGRFLARMNNLLDTALAEGGDAEVMYKFAVVLHRANAFDTGAPDERLDAVNKAWKKLQRIYLLNNKPFDPDKPTVLLIHGAGVSPFPVFNGVMEDLEKEDVNIAFIVFDFMRPIEELAGLLNDQVRDFQARYGKISGHVPLSYGFSVFSLAVHRDQEGLYRDARVVGLAPMIGGTKKARVLDRFDPTSIFGIRLAMTVVTDVVTPSMGDFVDGVDPKGKVQSEIDRSIIEELTDRVAGIEVLIPPNDHHLDPKDPAYLFLRGKGVVRIVRSAGQYDVSDQHSFVPGIPEARQDLIEFLFGSDSAQASIYEGMSDEDIAKFQRGEKGTYGFAERLVITGGGYDAFGVKLDGRPLEMVSDEGGNWVVFRYGTFTIKISRHDRPLFSEERQELLGGMGMVPDVVETGVLPDGRHFVVEEYVDGDHLEEHLKRDGADIRSFLRFLDAMINRKVFVKDFKPHNFVFGKVGSDTLRRWFLIDRDSVDYKPDRTVEDVAFEYEKAIFMEDNLYMFFWKYIDLKAFAMLRNYLEAKSRRQDVSTYITSDAAPVGGIDLDPEQLGLEVSATGDGVQLMFSEQDLERLLSASGVAPVITDVMPLGSVDEFLGLPLTEVSAGP